jgi:hypothetical protein
MCRNIGCADGTGDELAVAVFQVTVGMEAGGVTAAEAASGDIPSPTDISVRAGAVFGSSGEMPGKGLSAIGAGGDAGSTVGPSR